FHARTDRGAADGKGLPDTVQPTRHQIVHDVVTRGHRMKDLGDLARLFAFGDGLKAEMGIGRIRGGIRVLLHSKSPVYDAMVADQALRPQRKHPAKSEFVTYLKYSGHT